MMLKILSPRKESVKQTTYQLNILKRHHGKPLKIVHISDLHLGFQYSNEDLIYHINLINELNPHIVMITGDLFDNIDHYTGSLSVLQNILKTIRADVYFCYGNHDQRYNHTERIKDVLHQSNITLLNNIGEVYHYDGEEIFIAGTNDIINAKGNIEQALKRKQSDMFTLALVHEPDYAKFTKRFSVDLQLSGHSHGGQIRLPLIGAPVRPQLARRYVRGLYTLKRPHALPLHLHVSPGLGTTRLPLRFLCKAEITLFELNGKHA